MPILAQDMANSMRFALDAEGAEHYDDTLDIIPAINAAQRWLVNVLNIALGEKKIGEEIFQDISTARVFQTTKDSRISFSVFPEEVWTILAIYPLPETGGTGQSFTPPTENYKSALRTDLYHITSDNDAKRLTTEEWISNKDNPFEAGYLQTSICPDIQEYAYLSPINYFPDGTTTVNREIEIRPLLNQKNVTVVWARKPTIITALTDNIEFPDTAFQTIFNKALQYISYKQGDQTNLNSITTQDISLLIKSIQ
tara:strand:- start:18080 stop:18841 length:762 start_codon:yes stop_codon:yes gene_type:complete